MSVLTGGNLTMEPAFDEKEDSEILCLARDIGETSKLAGYLA